jgi:hypothetical protein
MGVVGQLLDPDALLPGETWYPLHRRLCGAQDRSGRVKKISTLSGFEVGTNLRTQAQTNIHLQGRAMPLAVSHRPPTAQDRDQYQVI